MLTKKAIFRHLPLQVIAIFALLLVSASPQAENAPRDNLVIQPQPDGTSIISSATDGYQFVMSDGWHPVLLPPTEAELQEFRTVIEEYQLPIDETVLPPTEEDEDFYPLLLGLELDPTHYANGIFMNVFAMAEIHLFPGAGLIPLSTMAGIAQDTEGIEDIRIIQKNGKEILIVDMAFEGIYAQMAIFVTNRKGVMFAFASNTPEMRPLLTEEFNALLDTFEFTVEDASAQ